MCHNRRNPTRVKQENKKKQARKRRPRPKGLFRCKFERELTATGTATAASGGRPITSSKTDVAAQREGVTGPRQRQRDTQEVVFENPTKFGEVKVDRQASAISLKLHKHLTLLRKEENQYMKKCLEPFRGKKRNTGKFRHDYHDRTKKYQLRCPLASCGYRSINQKKNPQSLRGHCGEFHRSPYTYIYSFQTPSGEREVRHPDPKTPQKRSTSQPPMADYLLVQSQSHAQGGDGEKNRGPGDGGEGGKEAGVDSSVIKRALRGAGGRMDEGEGNRPVGAS